MRLNAESTVRWRRPSRDQLASAPVPRMTAMNPPSIHSGVAGICAPVNDSVPL